MAKAPRENVIKKTPGPGDYEIKSKGVEGPQVRFEF